MVTVDGWSAVAPSVLRASRRREEQPEAGDEPAARLAAPFLLRGGGYWPQPGRDEERGVSVGVLGYNHFGLLRPPLKSFF